MIWPFQRLRYTTQLPAHEVLAILRRNVGESSWGTWFTTFRRKPEPYVGSVKGERFTIQRNKSSFNRNSFLPYLRGSVNPNGSGTELKLRFWLHPFVLGFSLLWTAIVYSACWPAEEYLACFLLWFLLLLMILAGYVPEAIIAERDLKNMIPPAGDNPRVQVLQAK